MIRREPILQSLPHIRDPRTLVAGDYADPSAPTLVLDRDINLTMSRVLDDVACQFRNGGRDERLLTTGETQLSSECTAPLPSGDNVDLGYDGDVEVIGHAHATPQRRP